jgi:hypothetical protein
MNIKNEDSYVRVKNPSTLYKEYFPRIFNPKKNDWVILKRFSFRTATGAILKAREVQEKIFYIYAERSKGVL